MEIETWRDTPKPGETDAGWCGLLSEAGHVVEITTGHPDQESVEEYLANRRGQLDVHLALKLSGML